MSHEEQDIKNVVEQVIRQEVPRLVQQMIIGIRFPYLGAVDQGCCSDKGCCRDYGCCHNNGCCVRGTGIMGQIAGRLDYLEAYIMSHKEEVKKFFQERGVELKL